MKKIELLLKELGEPYDIQDFDGEDCIHRRLDTGYEFEVSGTHLKYCTLYVWKINPRVVTSIYRNIPTNSLKDVLGYYATLYRNLKDQIQVEREDEKV